MVLFPVKNGPFSLLTSTKEIIRISILMPTGADMRPPELRGYDDGQIRETGKGGKEKSQGPAQGSQVPIRVREAEG